MESLIKTGDILVSTWGYDACLATFYKVLKRTPQTVSVVELDQQHTGSWHAGTAMPLSSRRPGKPKSFKVHSHAGYEYILPRGAYTARKWNGMPVATYNHH